MRLVVDRTGLPDRDKIITGSPAGDKVLSRALSPSLSLSPRPLEEEKVQSDALRETRQVP